MGLKPEVSITVGLATAALVWSIYSNATPPLADIRVGEKGDRDIDASRKTASWTAAGAVSAISLIAKDPTVFIIGGAMVVAVDWWTRHANEVEPSIGKAFFPGTNGSAPNTNPTLDEQMYSPDELGYVNE
jgi:hypothetical protein